VKSGRIIYAWDYVQWGGAQIYFLALMKELRKSFDLTVILPRRSDSQLIGFIKDLGVRCEFIDAETDVKPAPTIKRKIERRRNKWRSERALLEAIMQRDLSNTIVHIELSPWQSHRSLERLLRRVPVFVTAHNSLAPASNWRRRLWKHKLQSVAAYDNFWFLPSNQDSKRYFAQYFPAKFVRDRVRVTYTSVNPIEIDEALARPIDKSALKARFGIPENRLVVMCVGQFIDRKGRWTFLDAAKRLEDDHGLTFVWIANSPPADDDLRKAADYGLDDRFKLIVGETIGGRRELLEMFRIADIFVLASFVEGLPISLLEAMALGVPSISTNVNAIPEAVRDMETGLLIEAGADEQLAASIFLLKQNPDLRKRLSVAGREWVISHFDEREVARVAKDCYDQALGN
jgi:glycosyltransferase involved in cell wall biosynthesis